MKKLLEQLKALSDENRLRITMVLRERPMCVCEIFDLLDISGATLSAHLKILKNAGIIDLKKDGRFIEYFIADDQRVSELLSSLENMMEDRHKIDADRTKAATLNKESCSSKYSG